MFEEHEDWEEAWQDMIAAAAELIAHMDMNIALARDLWEDAFAEADRIARNRLAEIERRGELAVLEQELEMLKQQRNMLEQQCGMLEQGLRFEQAFEARRKFRLVENKADETE